jgi:O-antigen ligase
MPVFFIWAIAITEFLTFKPIQIIGYGLFGHYGSGASHLWSYFFVAYSNPEAVHPHNTFLSVLFDYGYLGAVFFLLSLFVIVNKVKSIWKEHKDIAIFFLAFFMYFVLISITESFFGFYYLDAIYIIFFFFLLPFNFNENNNDIYIKLVHSKKNLQELTPEL